MSPGALRALVRVEWRQLWLHRSRSLLVLLLITLPVAAIVGGSSLVRITQPGPEQRAAQAMGRADLRVDSSGRWEDVERIRAALPEGATVQPIFEGLERVSVSGRRLRARLFALEPAALIAPDDTPGLAAGLVQLTAGQLPTNAGEVALSPVLLADLDRTIGETVNLQYGASRTITGTVVAPEELDLPVVVRVPAWAEHPGRHSLLVDLPADLPAVDPQSSGNAAEELASALREAGDTVQTRVEASAGDDAITGAVFALGIIGLFEAALVISAAFAVGLRRRQVEIGLLGSAGATAGGITAALLVSAAIQALLAGLAGTLLGYLGVATVYPYLDGWTHRISAPFEILPLQAAAAIFLGVVAAVAAAVLPARSAARMPIRQALSGRRPTRHRSHKWLRVGLAMVTAGLVLLVLASHEHTLLRALGVVLGPIFGIIGFGACAPWLLEWSARRAAPLPLAWRLAVRDAGRFRERNGAVVTAVLAGMAMSVTFASLVASLEDAMAAFPTVYRSDQLLIEGPGAEEAASAIAERIPTLVTAPLRAVYTHGEPVRVRPDGEEAPRRGGWIAVGDERLARALGADGGQAALRQGRLLALDPMQDFTTLELTSWVSGHAVESPVFESFTTGQLVREPAYLIGAGALGRYGWETGPPPRSSLIPWLVRTAKPVTPELLEHVRRLASQFARTSVDAELLYGNKFRKFFIAVTIICALTGILIVIAATALSAAESAPDERALHTLGAAPRVLRSHFASRAGYLALLGCCLAVPAGLLAAAALAGAVNFTLDFVVPWRDLLVIVVGLPSIVYAGAWLFARTRGQHFVGSRG
ncbi:MAG: FtsX-like permease family protein [Acidobacteriota bacterium]